MSCVAYLFDIAVSSAVERIIRRAPQFVNVSKDDGFTALHLAALNGCVKTATVLIDTVSNQHDIIVHSLVNYTVNQTRSSAIGRESAHLTWLYCTVQKAFQYETV